MIHGSDGIVEIRHYQGVSVIGAEGVDILPETPCVWPGKKSAQSVLKWDILQMYEKLKLQKFLVNHVCSICRWVTVTKRETSMCLHLLVRLKEKNSQLTLGVFQ